MRIVLILVGVYGLSSSTLTIAAPDALFRLGGFRRGGEPLHYREVWQHVGTVVVLVGFLGKFFVASRMTLAFGGAITWITLPTIAFNF